MGERNGSLQRKGTLGEGIAESVSAWVEEELATIQRSGWYLGKGFRTGDRGEGSTAT